MTACRTQTSLISFHVILPETDPQQVRQTGLAGEKIKSILTGAPGNDAPIGRLKVIAETDGFTTRPSGTEDIYKSYAESFRGADNLQQILEEAQTIVNEAMPSAAARENESRPPVKYE